MRKRRINQGFLELVKSGQLQQFSLSELKFAYMALPSCTHGTDKAAWQFVYREVSRLEKEGILSRVAGLQGNKSRYQLTEKCLSHSESRAHPLLNEGTEVVDDAALRCLQEKLHNYKEEMLSVIGETEEYESICAQLPHMKNSVQAHYNDARERCSKMLGRVRALESILSNHMAAQSY